jgi:hypothetical protein
MHDPKELALLPPQREKTHMCSRVFATARAQRRRATAVYKIEKWRGRKNETGTQERVMRSQWLWQVAVDDELDHDSNGQAFCYAWFISHETMFLADLAKRLNRSEEDVRALLDLMVERGHLKIGDEGFKGILVPVAG